MSEYVQLTLDDWIQMKEKLKRELLGVKQSFVRIGYTLRRIDDQKLYERDGYASIAEFAQKEYGLEPSTTSRFISINREYSIDGYSEHLRPEYAEFGRSQLEEMLKLPENDRQMVTPEMPREDIRDLKRFNRTEPAAEDAEDIRMLIEKFFEENPETLNELYSSRLYTDGNAEKMAEIVNPSGSRTYRKGLFFLAMQEKEIKVKKFGAQAPYTMSWEQFFAIMQEVFEESAAGSRTWQHYFQKELPEGLTENPESSCNTSSEGTLTDEKEVKNKHEQAGTEEKEQKGSRKGRANDVEKIREDGGETQNCAGAKMPAELVNTERSGFLEQNREATESPDKVMTRKEYMDRLDLEGTVEFLNQEYTERNLTVSTLAYKSVLKTWLKGKVDGTGHPVKEGI